LIPPTVMPEIREYLNRPILELHLEDGRTLRLTGIPHDIAFEIWLTSHGKEIPKRRDPRLSMSELFNKIARINYVKITDIIPDMGVYVAEISVTIDVDGNEKTLTYQMIPSHAILLALRSGAKIYVAEDLVPTKRPKRRSSIDYMTYW